MGMGLGWGLGSQVFLVACMQCREERGEGGRKGTAGCALTRVGISQHAYRENPRLDPNPCRAKMGGARPLLRLFSPDISFFVFVSDFF